MSQPVNPNDLTRHQLDELDALLQRMLNLPMNSSPPRPPEPVRTPEVAKIAAAPSLPAPTIRLEPMPSLPRGPQVSMEASTPPMTMPTWGSDPLARYAQPATTNIGPAPSVPANFRIPAPEPMPSPRIELSPDTNDYPATIPMFGPPTTEMEPRTLRGVDAPANSRMLAAQPEVAPVIPAPVPLITAPKTTTTEPMNLVAPSNDPIPMPAYPVFGLNYVLEGAIETFGPWTRIVTNRYSKQLLGWCGVLLLCAAGAWTARGLGWIDFPLNLPTEFAEKLPSTK
ncbi:MAG: hypothetical protein ACRC8S_02320 [Fimbriiglobus sp.]